MSKRKIDKEATIKKILEAAEGHIKDAEKLKDLDEEEIRDYAMLWDVEIIYE